jgi:hypothetical protein
MRHINEELVEQEPTVSAEAARDQIVVNWRIR